MHGVTMNMNEMNEANMRPVTILNEMWACVDAALPGGRRRDPRHGGRIFSVPKPTSPGRN